MGAIVPLGYGARLQAYGDMPLGGSDAVERLRGGQGQVLAQTVTSSLDAHPVQDETDHAAARDGRRVWAFAKCVLRW